MKTTLFCTLGVVASLIAATVLSASAAPVKIELPQEPGLYKEAPGADLANAQCLTCHSREYVTTQPILGRKYWKAAVEKMRATFGAPIPPEQVDALVTYLVTNYGDEKK